MWMSKTPWYFFFVCLLAGLMAGRKGKHGGARKGAGKKKFFTAEQLQHQKNSDSHRQSWSRMRGFSSVASSAAIASAGSPASQEQLPANSPAPPVPSIAVANQTDKASSPASQEQLPASSPNAFSAPVADLGLASANFLSPEICDSSRSSLRDLVSLPAHQPVERGGGQLHHHETFGEGDCFFHGVYGERRWHFNSHGVRTQMYSCQGATGIRSAYLNTLKTWGCADELTEGTLKDAAMVICLIVNFLCLPALYASLCIFSATDPCCIRGPSQQSIFVEQP